MTFQENIPLTGMNTFRVAARARYFTVFSSLDMLRELPALENPLLILGGGSNVLFTRDFDGYVLKNEIRGIELLHEDPEYVYVKVGAGENWHQWVLNAIEKGWGGLENLSLIPGNVGAAPMQNIGAYGVELQDVFWDLEAYHLKDRTTVTFTPNDCAFGYRESVFKGRYKDQFVILNVTFRLRKNPVYHTSYGAIRQELEAMGVQELSLKAVSDAVIRIRQTKLPDPAEVGSAGSFFKNPVIPAATYEQLKSAFAEIPGYPQGEGGVKVPAGWLIEQCGWKGFRNGDAGCYPHQALVLVNYGTATGQEIQALSESIRDSVQSRFGVDLEREVNVY